MERAPRHKEVMPDTLQHLPDIEDDAAETEAMNAAIEKSLADPREVPHEEMREWLLKIAQGDFNAKPPVPRIL